MLVTKILEMTLFSSKDSTINEICELYYNIILLTVISYKKRQELITLLTQFLWRYKFIS